MGTQGRYAQGRYMQGRYTKPIDDADMGDLIQVGSFRESVTCGGFIDYDGFGYASNGAHFDSSRRIHPSCVEDIPDDATHVLWFNR